MTELAFLIYHWQWLMVHERPMDSCSLIDTAFLIARRVWGTKEKQN